MPSLPLNWCHYSITHAQTRELDPPTFVFWAVKMDLGQSPVSNEARPAMLLSSLVQTRSIELVLSRIASQVREQYYLCQ